MFFLYFVPFYFWLNKQLGKAIGWLSPFDNKFSNDESGELMKRFLAHKSWFDAIASAWIQTPALTKLVYFTGALIVSAVVGLLLSAVTLAIVVVSLFMLSMHALLYSHVSHRHEGAPLFAAEHIALNKDLKASNDFFVEATVDLEAGVREVNQEHAQLKKQVAKSEIAADEIAYASHQLTTLTETFKEDAGLHQVNTDKVQSELNKTHAQLINHQQAVNETHLKVVEIGAAATQFTDSVQALTDTQQTLAATVSRLGVFAKSPLPGDTRAVEIDSEIDAQIAENQRLIEELQARIAIH